MTEVEQDILQSLTELEHAVATAAANAKADLLPIFARLDELTQQLPGDTDPMLLHYLHRKSYQKARLLLEGVAGS